MKRGVGVRKVYSKGGGGMWIGVYVNMCIKCGFHVVLVSSDPEVESSLIKCNATELMKALCLLTLLFLTGFS